MHQRWQLVLVQVILIALVFGCGADADDTDDTTPRSIFWDTNADVIGASAESYYPTWELDGIIKEAQAVIVGTVMGEESREVASPVTVEGSLDAEAAENVGKLSSALINTPQRTTSTLSVSEWLSGAGTKEILVSTSGGFLSDGTAHFIDGNFLLEVGRTYVLALYPDGKGGFVAGAARGGFDLTDGVKVLNHRDTKDLEYLEDYSVEEFISYIESLLKS